MFYLPIYISFNAGFQRLPGEKDADAILRLIAVQFIDLPANTKPLSYNFRFTSDAVLEHIGTSAEGRTVVLLIDELNHLFREPVVKAQTGGPKGGGASLTACGQSVLKTYREAERKMRAAAVAELAAIEAILAP